MGRLVRPFVQTTPVSNGYFIVCPQATAERLRVEAFRTRLLERATEDEKRLADLWTGEEGG